MPRRSLTPPWKPSHFKVYPVRRTHTNRSGKRVPCWDVRMSADGAQYTKRFYRAAAADAWARDLELGHAAGKAFDPDSRRFVAPSGPTVYDTTGVYMRAYWSGWQPKTRQETARYLNRLRRELVRSDAPPPPPGIDRYLNEVSLTPDEPTAELDAELADARRWLTAASLPLDDIDPATARDWEGRYSRLSPASRRRQMSTVRAWWAHAADDGATDGDPWKTVRVGGTAGKRAGQAREVRPDEVLTPDQVRQLAGLIGARHRALVLVMGMCGLRIGEAAALRRRDLDDDLGWLTVRRAVRRVSSRYLGGDDDTYGPLKARQDGEQRRVPVPTAIRGDLAAHLDAHCLPDTDAPVFPGVRSDGTVPLDINKWRAGPWRAARDQLAALHPGVSPELRPHDLRHAAASMWLHTPGVDLKVAQRWGGWESLAVMVDVYAGVMAGREEAAVAALNGRLTDSP